jgi:hypothetical protein
MRHVVRDSEDRHAKPLSEPIVLILLSVADAVGVHNGRFTRF